MADIFSKSFSEIQIDIEDLETSAKGDSKKLTALLSSLTGGSRNPLETIKRICDLSREFAYEDREFQQDTEAECLGRTKGMLQFANFAALMTNLSNYAEESVAGFGFEALLAGMHQGQRIAAKEGYVTDIIVDNEKYSLKLLKKGSDSKMEGDLGGITLDLDMFHMYTKGKTLYIRKNEGNQQIIHSLDLSPLFALNEESEKTSIKKNFIEYVLSTITQDMAKHMSDDKREQFDRDSEKLKDLLYKSNFSDQNVEKFLDHLIDTSKLFSLDVERKVERQIDKMKEFLGQQIKKAGEMPDRPIHISEKPLSDTLTNPFFESLIATSKTWTETPKEEKGRVEAKFYEEVMRPRLEKISKSQIASPAMARALWFAPPELIDLSEQMRKAASNNKNLSIDLKKDLRDDKEAMVSLFSGLENTEAYKNPHVRTATELYEAVMGSGDIVDLVIAPPLKEMKDLIKLIDQEVQSGLISDGKVKNSNIIRQWLFSDDIRYLYELERNPVEKINLFKDRFEQKSLDEKVKKGKTAFSIVNEAKRFFESYMVTLGRYAHNQFKDEGVKKFIGRIGKRAYEDGHIDNKKFNTPSAIAVKKLFVKTGLLVSEGSLTDTGVTYFSASSPFNRDIDLESYITKEMGKGEKDSLGKRGGDANIAALEGSATERMIYIVGLKDMSGDSIFKMDFYYFVLTHENIVEFLQPEKGKARVVSSGESEIVELLTNKDSVSHRFDNLEKVLNYLGEAGVDVEGAKSTFSGNTDLSKPVLYTLDKINQDINLNVSLTPVVNQNAYLGSMLLDKEYLGEILNRYLGGTEGKKGVLEQLEEINQLFSTLKQNFYSFAGSFNPIDAKTAAHSADKFSMYMKNVTTNCKGEK